MTMLYRLSRKNLQHQADWWGTHKVTDSRYEQLGWLEWGEVEEDKVKAISGIQVCEEGGEWCAAMTQHDYHKIVNAI